MRREAEKAADMATLQMASPATSLRGIKKRLKLMPAIPEKKQQQLTSLIQHMGSPPAKPTRATTEINAIQMIVVTAWHMGETHSLLLGRRSQNEDPTGK